jgi:hypothetical protein
MPFVLVSQHTAEVRPYAQGELCCLACHHFRACPTPAPAVTGELIRDVFVRPRFASERRRPCGSQVLPLVSVTACRRPYSGSPTAARSHCFTIGIGLRPKRRGSASVRAWPGLSQVSDAPSNTSRRSAFTELQRSRQVTACGFGRPHRLGLTTSESGSNSGVPCRGKFRRCVTTPTRPLPLQPSGKLLNQTPFILEENKFQTSHTVKLTGRRSAILISDSGPNRRMS